MKYRRLTTKETSGFTIIELMIATIVFTVVLMICLAAIIQVGRMYYRGVTQAHTQEVIRSATEELTQSIQFSGQDVLPVVDDSNNLYGPTPPPPSFSFFCIGDKRYTFTIDGQVITAGVPDRSKHEIHHAFWVDKPSGGCANNGAVTEGVDLTQSTPTSAVPASGGRELLAEHMRLTKLDLIPTPDGQLWTLSIAVSYGDDEVLEALDPNGRRECKTATPGSQFCALSQLTTVVKRRVDNN